MLRITLLIVVLSLAGCARSPERAVVNQANKLLDDGQTRAASDLVEGYLQEHPDSAALLRMRVVVLLRAEKPDLAALALQQVPSQKSLVAEALRHRDRIVRENAAKLVANQPNVVDLREILRALEDSDPEVRRDCARALGQLGNPAALKSLFRLLSDDNWFVRAEAAIALGKIGDARAIGWLVQLLPRPGRLRALQRHQRTLRPGHNGVSSPALARAGSDAANGAIRTLLVCCITAFSRPTRSGLRVPLAA